GWYSVWHFPVSGHVTVTGFCSVTTICRSTSRGSERISVTYCFSSLNFSTGAPCTRATSTSRSFQSGQTIARSRGTSRISAYVTVFSWWGGAHGGAWSPGSSGGRGGEGGGSVATGGGKGTS